MSLQRARGLAAFLFFVGVSFVFSFQLVDAATPTVEVHVTDATTHQPLGLVRVLLDGTTTFVGFTDASGVARFEEIDAGSYIVHCQLRGYKTQESDPITVSGLGEERVDVTLAKSGLKTIGSVISHGSNRASPDAISPGSAIATVSGDQISSALGSLGNLENGQFSLDGRPANQTGVEIDGTPIGGLGGPANRGLNLDLFNAASASPYDNGLSSGNTLGLTTLEPTVSLQTSTNVSYGSNGRQMWHSWIRGSLGVIGVVFSHLAEGYDGLLAGLHFSDASGFDYTHRNGNSGHGDLLKVRAPVSTRSSFTMTALQSGSVADLVCDRVSGPLPCGFGPDNYDNANSHVYILKYDFHVPNFAYSGTIESNSYNDNIDQSHRFINGVADPVSNGTVTVTDAAFLNATVTESFGSTQLNLAAVRSRVAQTLWQPIPTAFSGTSSLLSATLTQNLYANRTLDVTTSLMARRNFIDKPLGASGTVTWRANSKDTVIGRIDAENGGATPVSVQSLDDPASLTYDCTAHAIFGDAVGDLPTQSSISNLMLSWIHRLPSGSFKATLLNQTQRGTSVSTIVNGAALTPAQLPPSYLNEIQQFYATPAGCGEQTMVTPSDIYLSELVSGVERVYSGAQFSFGQNLNRTVAAGAFVSLMRAQIRGNNSLLTNPYSISVPGRQLPNVPEFNATAIVDFKNPQSRIEFIGLGRFVGANNDRNLPPYTYLSAGASYRLSHGSLSLVGSNLLNSFTGTFVSPRYAVPYTTASGASVPTLAEPLPPRSVALVYTVHSAGVSSDTAQASQLAESDTTTPSVSFGVLPANSPANAFSLDTASTTCTPEMLPAARHLLLVLQNAAEQLQSIQRQTSSYPDAFALPTQKGLFDETLAYHKVGASYAISITFPERETLGIPCVVVNAAGDEAMARKVGAYTNTTLPSHTMEYVFMPRFGVYVVFHNGIVVKTSPPHPYVRPTDLLSVRPDCSSSARPLVDVTLSALRKLDMAQLKSNDIGNGEIITTKRDAAGHVFAEIRFGDPLSETIFSACTFTQRLSRTAAPIGVTTAVPNVLYYTTADGLFEVEATPR